MKRQHSWQPSAAPSAKTHCHSWSLDIALNRGKCEIVHLAIPATHRDKGEPLLIPATLIHLGEALVYFTFQGPTTGS